MDRLSRVRRRDTKASVVARAWGPGLLSSVLGRGGPAGGKLTVRPLHGRDKDLN